MVTKFKIMWIMILIISISLGCRENKTCFREYKFCFPSIINPTLDSFSIGDTIWYEINVNNLQEDQFTGQQTDITDLQLSYFRLFLSRFDTIHLTNSGQDFEFGITEGALEQTSWGAYLYLEEPNRTNVRTYFIPLKKGGYVLFNDLPPAYSEFESEISLNDPCFARVYTHSKVVSNNQNNDLSVLNGRYTLHQLQTGIDTFFWDEVEDPRDNGYYAFWVN